MCVNIQTLVDCRSEFISGEAAAGVRVLPLDRASVGGVGVDVAAEFASQVRDRGENAAGNDLAFDLGEPDLDLVEPRGISGGEVKLHARMLLQEVSDELGFVGGEVVEDDMNLLPGRAQRYHFCEEGHEVTAGVAGSGSTVHAAGLGVQRGIQRKRSMPVVLETVTLGSSRRERQNGVEAVQGLNSSFLIDAEHGGMLRRPQIQADNVGRFTFELRIVTGQVTLQAMGFQASFFPDSMHRVLADAQCCGQFAATPMRGTVAGFLAGGRQNPCPQRRGQNRGLLAGMIGVESVEPAFEEALLPADDGGSTRLQPALNDIERGSFCQHQDELSAKDVTRRKRSRLSNAAEFRALVAGEGHFAIRSHTNLEA